MRILFATCKGFLAYGISLVVAAHLLATSEASTATETAGPYRFEAVRGDDGVWRLSLLAAGFDAPF